MPPLLVVGTGCLSINGSLGARCGVVTGGLDIEYGECPIAEWDSP